LAQALEELGRLIWHSKRVWANGPTFDMNILEHAYKSLGMALPWKYYTVRDARTVYSLCPSLDKYPASHHALEDCRRQIDLLHDTLESLRIKEMI
jgi:exodeoxyribonuclease VIII